MSLCIRTIPNKLTSFISLRNKARKIDCQVSQNVPSAFLKEFLGKKAARNCINKMSRPHAAVSCVYQNISRGTFNNRYRNETRPTFLRNILVKNNDVYANVWQYNLAHSGRRFTNELKSTESLGIHPSKPVIDVWSEQSTLRDNNCINSCVNKPIKDSNMISINILQLWPNRTHSMNEGQSCLFSDASSNTSPTTSTDEETTKETNNFKATPTQVNNVFVILRRDLPQFFYRTIDYRIYSKDVEFVNNIKGVRTVGITAYIKSLVLLRLYANFRYYQVVMEVIKMTQHPEQGVIKVRWRIRCLLYFRTMLRFTKNKVWEKSDVWRDHEVWHDGFSTFYINKEGLIYRHIADKVMPNETYEEAEKRVPLASKLSLLMGIVDLDHFSSKHVPLKKGIYV